MKYSIKNSQQSLMNLFHPQNSSQYVQGNNQNLKFFLKNFKIGNNIISHNNCYISKFKTTKNSPERLLFEKTVNVQNNIDNKKANKFPVRGKIILGNQKKPEKISEELLRNKINKNKQKMSNKTNDNKNNSMNKGTIYRNINAHTSNTNIINDNLNININNISHILPNKNNGPNKNILGFDFSKQISGPVIAGPNSYRAPQKKSNNILDDEEYFIYINKNNKNSKNINNKNINKKNINDKKFGSFSTNKQRQKVKSNGVNFNTIIAKKNFYGQNKNNLSNLNSNIINKGTNLINNTKNNSNNVQKTNSIFSSTMSSLSKPRPQKQINNNHQFDVKSKTSYPTKNNSRKQSNEKTKHGDNKTTNNSKNKYKNYSNINHMRVFSDKNKYIHKNKPNNASQNNTSNNNYKISANNNNIAKKYIYNSNIVQIIPNGLNVSQYKLSNINSANNSKEYSRENSSQQNKKSSNIIDLKKSSVEKLLSQLHKNKDNSYNNLSRDDHDLKEKISSIMNKNIYTNLNNININYRDLKKNSKIIVNKNSNPIILKDEKISEKNSNVDLKEKEQEKHIISLKDKIKENNKEKEKNKEQNIENNEFS